MEKPHGSGGLLAVAVLGAMIVMLWAVDREVTQGKVTEFFAMFR